MNENLVTAADWASGGRGDFGAAIGLTLSVCATATKVEEIIVIHRNTMIALLIGSPPSPCLQEFYAMTANVLSVEPSQRILETFRKEVASDGDLLRGEGAGIRWLLALAFSQL